MSSTKDVPARDRYAVNPLVHQDRRRGRSGSAWVRSFACDQLKPLIVCRGPIRKEAIEVFREMGMTHVGMLLSHKDSIVYPNALAPELRRIDPAHVHHVPDYTGATREARQARIREIIEIAQAHGYDAVFAGYGFMAEDEDFVGAIEDAGLLFMGPNRRVVRAAGKKDEAKRTALQENVSVTPGVDDVTTRLMLDRYPTREGLLEAARAEGLVLEPAASSPDLTRRELALAVLDAAYTAGVDLYTVDELAERVAFDVSALLEQNPGRRVRLKAIGGGGGKGQRIIDATSPVADRAREVLAEVKATGAGDDKNMLIELNIEATRHNEIQLLGNGEWCVALGGRDCSLQMHEQKLLEVSITREDYTRALEAARRAGRPEQARALEIDRQLLERMEDEAARFGRAVGLDSASTFECIVEGDRHYFMEVNTRIQVEHRVTEMCYTLRFRNPNDSTDYFDVTSLVEAMALLARHKKRLPLPERCPRFGSGAEARINATDDALQPHAGGEIINWSAPIEGEIRDDQGICQRNPDTGRFMRYKVAGAYDSNIALLVTHGEDRKGTFDHLSEILRLTKLRGIDVSTNLDFHYGLLSWFRATEPLAKPTTGFVLPYLAQVGRTFQAAQKIDLDHAWQRLWAHDTRSTPPNGDREAYAKAVRSVLGRKSTLVCRPLSVLLHRPHLLAGWLSLRRRQLERMQTPVRWRVNPLEVLRDTYRELNMDHRGDLPAAHAIWDHDEQILSRGLAFYTALADRLGVTDYPNLAARLLDPEPPPGFGQPQWTRARGAHRGHQLGLELLSLLADVGLQSGFYALAVRPDLTIDIPDHLRDPALQDEMRKVLAPPPKMLADRIVAISGGMYYGQEGPGRPPFVTKGTHFSAGDTLYIIEVMKMFNRVPAPFSGTIEELLLEGKDGTVVHKGQPLFKVAPDERIVPEDPVEVARRRRDATERAIARLLDAR